MSVTVNTESNKTTDQNEMKNTKQLLKQMKLDSSLCYKVYSQLDAVEAEANTAHKAHEVIREWNAIRGFQACKGYPLWSRFDQFIWDLYERLELQERQAA